MFGIFKSKEMAKITSDTGCVVGEPPIVYWHEKAKQFSAYKYAHRSEDGQSYTFVEKRDFLSVHTVWSVGVPFYIADVLNLLLAISGKSLNYRCPDAGRLVLSTNEERSKE